MSKRKVSSKTIGYSITFKNLEYIDELIQQQKYMKRSTALNAVVANAKKQRWFLDV